MEIEALLKNRNVTEASKRLSDGKEADKEKEIVVENWIECKVKWKSYIIKKN